MIKRFLIFLAAVVMIASSDRAFAAKRVYPLAANSIYEIRVERVVDGDTIIAEFEDKTTERVRMIGVNTPESVAQDRPVEYFGKEASSFTKRELTGKRVILITDVETRDKYGRALAYLWTEMPKDRSSRAEIQKKMFNARLLIEGYAQVMTVPPNTAYAKIFRQFQREARDKRRGLWGREQ